ncbi:MAG: radical SAM protein [Kangiellaceae bacterium]|jgi:radical SAM superfamily enzyme YgiQ (UPF0313 family)|nr:radical SAM protein [Kangiellaceae bacterium]
MKIVFITTEIKPHAMNLQYAMDIVGCDYAVIPLPLATLAGLTPSHHELRVIDENVEAIPDDLDADIVAFSGILCQKDGMLALAKKLKAKGIHVAMGGPIVHALQEQCAEVANTLFLGEAENIWREFIEDFENDQPKDLYQESGFVDMADSPIPRFDLIKTDRYVSGAVQATRGCPYACDYCDVPTLLGKKPRSKSIEQVVEEIKIQAHMGFDSIFIVDDHFAADPNYAKKLLRAIADLLPSLPKKLYFYTQVPINVAKDEELLDLMQAANMRRLFIGLETSDKDKLIAMNKVQNNRVDMEQAIHAIQKRGIIVWAGILFGYDGETKESFNRELEFIKRTGITPMLIGLVQALPGTPLFDKMQAQERVKELPMIMGNAATGDSEKAPSNNIIYQSNTYDELNKNFHDFLLELYTPENYTEFVLKGASREVGKSYSGWPNITWNNIKLLYRVIKFYLTAEKADRAIFTRFIGAYLKGQAKNIEELFFHLGIYKHHKEFYSKLANNIEANA